MAQAETIMMKRESFEHLISDFEQVITDMESIADQETMVKVDKRLQEIKEGKVKGRSEDDFLQKMKEEGIDVSGIRRRI